MIVFWSVATVAFLVIEAATVGLSSIWFALGSICALVATLLGAPLWLQIVWFVIISVVTLILTRPLVKKYVNGRREPTNADRLVGTVVRVTEKIDNISGTGTVLADGKTWSARSLGGEIVGEGELVTVKDIQGVKLIVSGAGERQPE